MDLFHIYKAAEKAINDARAEGVDTEKTTIECDERKMSVRNIPSINITESKFNSEEYDGDIRSLPVLYIILLVAALIAPILTSSWEDYLNGSPNVIIVWLGAIPMFILILLCWACRFLSIPFVILLEASTFGLIGNIYKKKKAQKEYSELLQKRLSASEVLQRELPHYIEMYSQEANRLEIEDEKEWNRVLDMGFPPNSVIFRLGENNVCVPFLDSSRFFFDNQVNTLVHITCMHLTEGNWGYGPWNKVFNLRTVILPCSIEVVNLYGLNLQNLELPSSVSSIDGVPNKSLQTLTVVLNKGNDEEFVMKALKDVVTDTTTVQLKWDNFLWDPDEDYREDLFVWKEELLNLDSQIQNGDGIQPFHISGDHLFRANKFKISFIEG